LALGLTLALLVTVRKLLFDGPPVFVATRVIDQVLSLVPDPARLRFRNLVSMDDLAAMRRRGAEYVILHKRFEAQLPEVALPLPDLDRLRHQYQKALGEPFYEDTHIAVFRL
jgi:hypothetical protein